MTPHLVVFSSLFPTPAQPVAGIFIKERMFRVARILPVVVVSPSPWFPLQGLIRKWRPQFRLPSPRREVQDGIEVLRPRFLSIPMIGRRFDGISMAVCAYWTIARLHRSGRLDILDAHFGYPDGYAATLLGRWLRIPVTITLRGTEVRHARDPVLRGRLRTALHSATRLFSVSASMKEVARGLDVPDEKVVVIGNGVDLDKFRAVSQNDARRQLGLPANAKVLVSVGGLVERKGFHRVIECLPALRERVPDLHLLIVGGSSAEGDWTERLQAQVAALGLASCVHFLGVMPPERLCTPLSAADVFVLATRNEGWANVFLEAMACGLPVVTTRVGGNAEVVRDASVGELVPFDDPPALTQALHTALNREWDHEAIRDYAQANGWERRVALLVDEFKRLALPRAAKSAAPRVAT